MPVIHIPRTLRERLGEQGADELANLLNRATEDASRDTLVLAEEKYERRLSQEMAMMNQNVTETRAELNQHIAEVKTELDQRITEVEARLQTQLAETKADLIRWMFIFWVGQLATILGVLFVFFK